MILWPIGEIRARDQDVLERCYKTEGGVAEPFRPDAVPRYAGVVGALQVIGEYLRDNADRNPVT